MYLLIAMFTSLMGVASTTNLVLDRASLLNDNGGLSFDASNYSDGVVPALGVINAEKFIYGEALQLEEIKDFWTAFINANVVNDTVLTNNLYSNGTKMFITCNEPMRYCSQLIDDKECKQKLLQGLDHLLTATPLTSFSTAYGIRGDLAEIPNLPGRSSRTMQDHALLFQLAKTNVDVVEMTIPSIGGYGENQHQTEDFERFTKLTTDLRSKSPTPENKRFKDRLETLGLHIPRITWLLMTHTTELGSVADTDTATFADGQCTLVPLADGLKSDPETGLYSVLVNFDEVVGVDVAGPEVTCFTKDGMAKFKKLAETTYFASQTKRQKGNNGKLVVRAHVGEGVALMKEDFLKGERESCNAIEHFPAVEYIFDRTTNVPIHVVEAQKNIAYILDAISELKEKYPDINDYVVFRLAHLTHITQALAKRAKALGITADVSLSSNIATGALTLDPGMIDKFIRQQGFLAVDVTNLLDRLIQNGAKIGDIFNDHGLKWLLYYHVPTMLGSDGPGVEHVESMRKEYRMADELIQHWNRNDPDFSSMNVTTDELLQNQRSHYEVMNY